MDNLCPMCGATVTSTATDCRYCGETIGQSSSDASDTRQSQGWILHPPRRLKIAIGAMTYGLSVYLVVCAVTMAALITAQVSAGTKAAIPNRWALVIIPIHIASIVLSFALLTYYLTFVFRCPRFQLGQRLKWLVLF